MCRRSPGSVDGDREALVSPWGRAGGEGSLAEPLGTRGEALSGREGSGGDALLHGDLVPSSFMRGA